LAKGFQRRRLKCEKLTDDRRRTTSDDKSSHCLWQGELIIVERPHLINTDLHLNVLKCLDIELFILYLICCPCPPLIT